MRHDSLPADPFYDPRLPFWTLGRHKSLLLSRQRCTTLIRKPGESTLCTAMPPPRTRAGFLKDSPGPDYPATNRPSGENSSDFQCFFTGMSPSGSSGDAAPMLRHSHRLPSRLDPSGGAILHRPRIRPDANENLFVVSEHSAIIPRDSDRGNDASRRRTARMIRWD